MTALKRLDLGGGAPQTIASGERFGLGIGIGAKPEGTWGADGVILYAESSTPPLNHLRRISAAGGAPTLVTPIGPEMTYFGPSFLPDGKRFLFTAFGGP